MPQGCRDGQEYCQTSSSHPPLEALGGGSCRAISAGRDVRAPKLLIWCFQLEKCLKPQKGLECPSPPSLFVLQPLSDQIPMVPYHSLSASFLTSLVCLHLEHCFLALLFENYCSQFPFDRCIKEPREKPRAAWPRVHSCVLQDQGSDHMKQLQEWH